jgi:hypothetical protein
MTISQRVIARRLGSILIWSSLIGLSASATMSAHAGVIVYSISLNGGLAGFDAAAGNPPISIDLDGIAHGTSITGQTISGVTFSKPDASYADLIVVNGNNTTTSGGSYSGVINATTNKLFPTSGANVLSPGGSTLGPGLNDPVEKDGVQLVFATPLAAFGLDHLSQSADGVSFTTFQVFNQSNGLLASGTLPISNVGGLGGGAPGGADFWGVIATGADLIGGSWSPEATTTTYSPTTTSASTASGSSCPSRMSPNRPLLHS